jgi:hypothetical protein
MKHFVNSTEHINIIKIIMFAILMIPTLGAPFWLMYEYWFANHYWKNRWRFNRLLNKNMVKIEFLGESLINMDIKRYLVTIEDSEYSLWVWKNNYITLDDADYKNSDYIGLFAGSLITRHLNKLAIKKIQKILKDNE